MTERLPIRGSIELMDEEEAQDEVPEEFPYANAIFSMDEMPRIEWGVTDKVLAAVLPTVVGVEGAYQDTQDAVWLRLTQAAIGDLDNTRDRIIDALSAHVGSPT